MFKKHSLKFLSLITLSAYILSFQATAYAGLFSKSSFKTNSITVTAKKDANTAAGLTSDISVTFSGSSNKFSGTLNLPANVDPAKIQLTWSYSISKTVTLKNGSTSYSKSNKLPIAGFGESITYTASASNYNDATYTITTQKTMSSFQVSDFSMNIPKNEAANLSGNIAVTLSGSGTAYSGTIYVPGEVDTSLLTMNLTSKVEGTKVKAGSTEYPLSEIPLLNPNGSNAYTISAEGYKDITITINAMKGSTGIKSLFLNIDESYQDPEQVDKYGKPIALTIAAMNADEKHNVTCYGTLDYGGKNYPMSIKGRGNYTWKASIKKAYNFTIYDVLEDGTPDYTEKKKAEMIKGIKTKKWSILSNSSDPTMLRNKVGYDLANQLGIGLDSNYIDVWINGSYNGVYLMTPKSDYEASDDGYFLELDNKYDDSDPQITLEELKNPANSQDCTNLITVKDIGEKKNDQGVKVPVATVEEIRDYLNEAMDALLDFDSDAYTKYFDVDSFAKLYLIQELVKNYDIICGSMFMHRDGLTEKDKLIAGPVWDLDNSLGRIQTCDYCGVPSNITLNGISGVDIQHSGGDWFIGSINMQYNPSATNNNKRQYTCLLQYLGMHEDFIKRVYEIYNEYKPCFDNVMTNIDTQNNLISTSVNMNFTRWKLDQSDFGSTQKYDNHKYSTATTKKASESKYDVTYKKTSTQADYVENFKTFMSTRLQFLSDKLYVPMPSGTVSGNTELKAGDSLELSVDCVADSYQWQVSSKKKVWNDIEGATSRTYTAQPTLDDNGKQYRCVVTNYSQDAVETPDLAKITIGNSIPEVLSAAKNELEPVTLSVTPIEQKLTSFNVTGKTFSLEVQGTFSDIGKVYVGLYDNGKLCELHLFDMATANKINGTFTNSGNKAKAFWWSDQMVPFCTFVEASIQ